MNSIEDPPERHWPSRWAKALLAAVLSVLAIAFGVALKPPKPLARDIVQPTITIFASQPDVSAVVTMNAYPYPASTGTASTGTASTGTATSGTPARPVPGYELDIALKVLSPRTSEVTFLLLLSDFPQVLSTGITGLRAASTIQPETALSAALPVPAQDAVGHADFVALRNFVPPSSARVARTKRPSEPTIKIATQYSVVSRSSGSELQVAFPLVLDEKSGSSFPPTRSPILISSLLEAYQNRPADLSAYPVGYYEPNLEPGDFQYRPSSGTNLADYQALAGTSPVIRPAGAWSWAGIGEVSLLAQDALTADLDQEHLFWDGVAWGVAGAGGIAAVLELVSAVQGERDERAKKRLKSAGQPGANSAAVAGTAAGQSG